jgi:hypothetical protein
METSSFSTQLGCDVVVQWVNIFNTSLESIRSDHVQRFDFSQDDKQGVRSKNRAKAKSGKVTTKR